MKNFDGLLNRKEKKNILVARLWPMKRKQLVLLRVIDISKKKKKKKKEKKRKKRKEKKKYIGCSSRTTNIFFLFFSLFSFLFFFFSFWPMKRKQLGLLPVIDIS